MPDTITVHLDDDGSRALAALTSDGSGVSSAVCHALVAAARDLVHAELRAEAEELASDEADLAEAAQVLRDMETLRAW